MSKSPSGIVATQMTALPTVATSIESLCDPALETNYRGNYVEVDINATISSITSSVQRDIVINLVRLKYPKWKIEVFNETKITNHIFLRFNAIDFT